MDIPNLFKILLGAMKNLCEYKNNPCHKTNKSKKNYYSKKIKEEKDNPKKNKLVISYYRNQNFVRSFKQIFFILILIKLVAVSPTYEIKIKLLSSEGSRIMDMNGRTPYNFCKNTECKDFNNLHQFFKNNNNILYINGGTTTNDIYTFKWYSDLTSLKGMFKNCHNITSIEFINFDNFDSILDISEIFLNCTSLNTINFGSSNNIFNNVIDMSYMFTNCTSLFTLDLTKFGTSKVKKMNNMFDYCIYLNQLQQNFDTKSVDNMEYMFSNCKNLDSLDISNFDITLVTNMNSMFKGCNNLNKIIFPQQTSPSLIDMAAMFQSCSSIITLNLTNFDTSSVLFMNDLFHDCISLKELEISNFDTERVIKMESMFQNCKGLTKINLSNFYTPSLRQFHHIFSGCSSVTSIDITKFDTFQITNFACLFYDCNSLTDIDNLGILVTNMANNMSHMFYNCSSFTNFDLSKFKTEKVTDMNSMFKGCTAITNINLSNFIYTQVEDMAEMFYGCTKLENFTMTKFGPAKVKNMKGMFYGCISFEILDLDIFNTSNVLNMNSMFYECFSLKMINLASFDTSKVTDMGMMFYDCSLLFDLNITHFNTKNVRNIDWMFYNCKNLKYLNLINFDTSQVTSMKSIFYRCTTLELLDLSNFDTKNVEYMDSLFYDCSSLIKLDLENFTLTKVKSMGYMFHGCISLTSIILPDFTRLCVTNTSYMFESCSSLVTIDLSNFDSSHIITMDYMFSDCSNLENLYLKNWNTKNVETMNYLFNGCSSLKHIDISHFKTPKLKSIRGMFYACTSLEDIDLSDFNTSLVTNMDFLFFKNFNLQSINFLDSIFYEEFNDTKLITSFNTSSAENMRYMFSYCSQLQSLDISFFETSKVRDMSYMFAGCSNLTSMDLSNFLLDEVLSMEKMFFGCHNLSFINFNYTVDTNKINMVDIYEETPLNMVFCLDKEKVPNMHKILEETKEGCFVIECEQNYLNVRKKRLLNDEDSQGKKCTDFCKNYNLLDFKFDCLSICPNETYEEYFEKEENRDALDYKCRFLEEMPEVCTLQKVILEIRHCRMHYYEHPYNNTNEDKVLMIEDIKNQIPYFDIILPIVYKEGLFSKIIYNETYQISLLSDKNVYDNLTFIDIQDCENVLKQKNDINPNEELILFKIEYPAEEYRIPILEYTVLKKDGTELNISDCGNIEFIYYIPLDIDITDEEAFNPESEYNNELCFQYTTEDKTDKLLYERRKEFNEDNRSLCEKGCKYLGYENKKIICQCQIKSKFNKYLKEDKSDLVFKFENNHFQKYNFWVLKCFKMIFNKNNIKSNYASIIYIGIIIFNFISGFIFCIRGYKILYIQTRLLIESMDNSKKYSKNVKILKNNKSNLVTTNQNPPQKIKNNNAGKKGMLKVNSDLDKKLGKGVSEKSKVNGPSALIDSKNKINLNSSLMINKKEEKEEEEELKGHFLFVTDMEVNMLSYAEAQKSDKRGCFHIYFSFIKSRHILVCIFFRDFNSILFKICFFFFIFGICLGFNTIFFDDKVIQTIYEAKGQYKTANHIVKHLINIGISTAAASIVKSIMSLISFTDVAVLQVKDDSIPKDEKINQSMINITSKITRFYIINFILVFVFWIYAGSFCSVFQNTQIYLLINAAVSFGGVIILPFLYYFLPALLRKISLSGDGKCLYQFSQIFEQI